MSWEDVREANASGRAVAVLSPGLDVVHWANSVAIAALGFPAATARDSMAFENDDTLGLALERISERLAVEGEASLRLAVREGSEPGLMTGHVFLTRSPQGVVLAVLSATVPGRRREDPAILYTRILDEACGAGERAVLVDEAAGRVVRRRRLSVSRADELLELADEFGVSGESLLSIEEGDEELLFARLSSDLVLVRITDLAANEDDVPAPEAQAPARAEVTVPAPEPEPAAPATPLGTLVDRWSRRLDATPANADFPASGPEAPAPGPVLERPVEAPAASISYPAFKPNFTRDPVRFVWQIDPAGSFRFFSPEFAQAVGPAAADVVGRAFADVAERFGFDETGDIGRLMSRRDTWSGRSVYWPVENSDRKVLVDLAALPMYDAGRSFQGFRGFGIVRLDETVEDPDAIGLHLAAGGFDALAAPDPLLIFDEDEHEEEDGPAEVLDDADDEPVFGRRQANPPFEERRPSRERPLSSEEASAFRLIGATLTPEAGAPEKAADPLRFSDELSTLFAAMPVAALLQVRETPVEATRGFYALTGYPSLEAFVASGGLDALFVDEPEIAVGERVLLRRADGERVAARVQMQRVTLAGRSSLAFFFLPPETHDADAHAETSAGGTVPELEALRGEAEELRSVLDTATDGVVFLDPSGSIRAMNGSAEALLDTATAANLGRPFTDLLNPESRAAATTYLETLRANGLAGILNDGREVLGEIRQGGTVPLFITIGRLPAERGWCMVMRDITHWKKGEEELVAARRQAEDASLHKSRFLANISHELRTPLNAIIGFADVMASECFGPIGHERYLEYLGDIKRSGHHVLDLVNDLLDISKIEAGKVELNFEAVALNEVLSEVVSLMQPQANRERVIVRSNLPENVPQVVADRRSIRQIALNLIANAIRFTPAGGQIIASTSLAPSGEVALRFRDSGIGMTEREIEIALTPFRQVPGTGRDRSEGTGLGLPLTKAMTEANRALFQITSAPGEGTVIEIVFPAQRVLTL